MLFVITCTFAYCRVLDIPGAVSFTQPNPETMASTFAKVVVACERVGRRMGFTKTLLGTFVGSWMTAISLLRFSEL